VKKISLILITGLYIVAGINHFIHPGTYRSIMPHWVPFPGAAIFVSGVCEVLFALLLIPRYTRRMAAWGIILLLIAVFPANIQMTLNYFNEHHPGLWLTIIRLPLQVVLIWWAYGFSKPAVTVHPLPHIIHKDRR
jgi:uncharacterized membrane protein